MPIKRLASNDDPGSATRVGGNDWNKIADFWNGSPNTDSFIVDSNLTLKNNRLKFSHPTSSKVITLKNDFISENVALYWPSQASANDDTILSANNIIEITNKTVDASKNTFRGVAIAPSRQKWGYIMAGPVVGGGTGDGLFNGFVDMPSSPTTLIDSTEGNSWRYSTSTTANTRTGIRHRANFCRKEFHPRLRAKVRTTSTITSTRQLIGFWTDPFGATSDDTIFTTSQSGVFIGWRSGDSHIHTFRNGGTSTSGSTMTVDSLGITRDTTVKSYEIDFFFNAASGNNEVRCTVYDAAGIEIAPTPRV